jgi:hypothetical protein
VDRLARDLSVAEGKQAAELALNVLAQITLTWADSNGWTISSGWRGMWQARRVCLIQPAVLDGASDLFAQVLGDKAGHARAAYSATQQPGNAAVILVVIAQIKGD